MRDLSEKVETLLRSPKPASTPTFAVPPSPSTMAPPTGPSGGHSECNRKLDELWQHAKQRIKLVDEKVDELKQAVANIAVAGLAPGSGAGSRAGTSGASVDQVQHNVSALQTQLATLSTNAFASMNRLLTVEDTVTTLKTRVGDLESATAGAAAGVSSSSSSDAGDVGDAAMAASDSDDDDDKAEPGEVMQD